MKKLFSMNLRATLYFNFKVLPFRQAIHLPIVLYNRIKFRRLTGQLVFECEKVSYKMVQIGAHGSDMFSNYTTTIDLAGSVVIYGDSIRIGTGSLLRVEPKAKLELYHNSILGARNIIFCCNSIDFKENSLFSWDCQILDSDTHSLMNMETGEVGMVSKGIVIGCDCWIGNHVVINKGTILPEGTIVSSMSLCNKDYSGIINKYSVIGGIPAKLLLTNRKRLNDKL